MPNFRAVAVKAAQQNGVNPRIFLAQIGKESGFNPNARSSSGAVGIAQIVPHWHPGVDATDPVASLYYAAHWMGQLVKKYGNYQQALSVYNSGDPNAYKDPHFADGQTFNYVKSIMGATAAPAVSPKMPGLSTLPQSMPGLAPIPPPPGNPLLSGLEGIGRQLGLPSIRWPHPATSTFNPMPLPVGRDVQVPAMPLPLTKGTALNMAPLSGIAKTALTQIGIPYQFGGLAKLGRPTDCSGLLQASAAANGVNIGRTTYEQWKQGTPVALTHLRPGDAVFFDMTKQGPGHVAIYIGNGRVVEDPHTGASVEISQLAGRGAVGARRY